MGDIVLLDELTINQIAAGEVIERPANVVKELVENSIDAGATNITVEIKNGGISYIRVIDNGKGIKLDDLEIAFERHATSKIRNSDDLLKVMTMGFRGEALASIASVANVELVTCPKNMDIGSRIVVEAGNILEKEEYGCPKGTTITIKNLFFNTPVRYKFLKRDFTEAGYIEDSISKLALINPNISFKLINSGKVVINTTGNNDIITAIHNIYGSDISNFVIPVEYKYENMKISGVIGKAEIARSNRANQIIYINKRCIKNKTIGAAIDEAYKTIIPVGKFGFAVLNLEINPELVDVNVHPAKLEVRFQNEGEVFKAFFHATKNALLGNDLSRIIQDSSKKQEEIKENAIEEIKKEEFRIKENIDDISNIGKDTIEKINIYEQDIKPKYSYSTQDIDMLMESKEEVLSNKIEVEDIIIKNKQEDASIFIDSKQEEEIRFRYIGTAFKTYIIIEYQGELYIIDQHAMHERVMYEKVKQTYYSGKVLSQIIMIPEVLTLTNRENELIKQNIEMFEKVGYVLENFGDNTIKITGVPYICMELSIKDIFLDILDGLQDDNKTYTQLKEDKFLATVACKAAVKANNELKIEEVNTLITEALKLENPFTCPHGRPTAIKMSKYEIERKFGRK